MTTRSAAFVAMTGLLCSGLVAASCSSVSSGSETASNTASDSTASSATESVADSAGTERTTSTVASTSETAAEPTTTSAVSTTTAPATTSPESAVNELASPTSASELADALSEAEAAIRDRENVNTSLASAWGQRQQRLYRILASNPDWADEVISHVSDEARFAVTKNWEARKDLTKLVKSAPLATTLPAWRLREPLPADVLLDHYHQAEAETGIPWNYLAAINLVETRMGRIEGLSTAGATGPMQFLPSTWAECCEGDPKIDLDAIIGAGVYLSLVGGTDDIQKALYRYNNSDRYVASVTHYAEVMADDEWAYRGYHAWQVYFLSASGLLLLPSGYYEPEPIAVTDWLAQHPDALIAD